MKTNQMAGSGATGVTGMARGGKLRGKNNAITNALRVARLHKADGGTSSTGPSG
jgi:hypothetical protein